MPYWMKWSYAGHPIPNLYAYRHPLMDARQYASHAAYRNAETIQLIRDFKIPPNSGPELLERKKRAIQRFADEITTLLETCRGPWLITWIPTSKAKDDPAYDDRFEQVLTIVGARCKDILPVSCFQKVATTASLHSGGGVRDSNSIKSSWIFTPPELLASGLGRILVLDDVITTGASMRAAFDLLDSVQAKITVIGVAWALTRASYPSKNVATGAMDAAELEKMITLFEDVLNCPENEVLRRHLLAWINACVLQHAGIFPLDVTTPLKEARGILESRILQRHNAIKQKAYEGGYDACIRGVARVMARLAQNLKQRGQ